jgi:hypothetical protein
VFDLRLGAQYKSVLEGARVTDTSLDWVTLTSVISGFLLGAMGILLSYRARTSSLRERLHEKQVELALQIVDLGFDALRQVSQLRTAGTGQRDTLYTSARAAVDAFVRASWRGLVVLPGRCSEAANVAAAYSHSLLEISYSEEQFGRVLDLTRESHWKFIRLARTELGVAPLSEETQMLVNRADSKRP